jgi:hypothetical protein
VSLIDIPLWSQAKWNATVYGYHPDTRHPGFLAIGFRNEDAAKTIFQGLRTQIGEVDKNELLRISVITGINKKHPSHYHVLISLNPNFIPEHCNNAQ